MNFNHLKYAAEVAKYESISKAAQQLLLSQPYLSSMIGRLEVELGYKIFHRTPTGVTLTPEGELFMHSSNRILLELKKIQEIRPAIAVQDLSISCYYATYIMKHFLKFRDLSPSGFSDRLKEMGIREVMDSVISGDSRIGIFFYADECQDIYTRQAEDLGLHMQQLFPPMKVYAICSPKHPLASQSSITTADLLNSSFVCYDDAGSRSYLQILGFTKHARILEVSDRGGLYDALRSGGYLSIMAYQTPPQQDEFIILPFSDNERFLLSGYLTLANYQMSKREAAFLNYLKSGMVPERFD